MKEIKDICVLVSARLNSHRIPQKMVRDFAGETLIDICLKKILESKVIPKENIIFAAHEPMLKDIAKKYGVNIYHRSEESSKSEGNKLTVLYDWHDKIDYKYVIMINPCLPFLSIESIDNFFDKYRKSDYDGMFGVIEKRNYFWNSQGNLITEWPKGLSVMNTKYVSHTFEAAHCLYASKLSSIKEGSWMGKAPFTKNNPVIFPIPEEECFDIDYLWQFNMAQAYYREKKNEQI